MGFQTAFSASKMGQAFVLFLQRMLGERYHLLSPYQKGQAVFSYDAPSILSQKYFTISPEFKKLPDGNDMARQRALIL